MGSLREESNLPCDLTTRCRRFDEVPRVARRPAPPPANSGNKYNEQKQGGGEGAVTLCGTTPLGAHGVPSLMNVGRFRLF